MKNKDHDKCSKFCKFDRVVESVGKSFLKN